MNIRSQRPSVSIKYFSIGLFVIPTLITLFAFTYGKGKDGLKIGKKMPMADLEMAGTDGNMHTLNSLLDENGLVVVFSCNTCPFVVGNENFVGWEVQYNDLHKNAADNKMGFVLINSNEAKREGDDSMDKMKEHASEAGYTMNYLEDSGSVLADEFGAKTTPHVFVFDKDSKLIYKGSIDNSWDSKAEQKKYLLSVYDYIANGTKLENPTTPPRGCSIKRLKTE